MLVKFDSSQYLFDLLCILWMSSIFQPNFFLFESFSSRDRWSCSVCTRRASHLRPICSCSTCSLIDWLTSILWYTSSISAIKLSIYWSWAVRIMGPRFTCQSNELWRLVDHHLNRKPQDQLTVHHISET